MLTAKGSLGFFLILALGTAAAQPGLLQHLRCEGLDRPLSVEAKRPRLSWQLGDALPRGTRETAAKITVATTEAGLGSGAGVVWDSGWVSFGELSMAYAGPVLAPDTSFWWRISARTLDTDSQSVTRESLPASFHTAPSVWTGKWIAAPWSTERDGAELDGSRPMPMFRRDFRTSGRVVEAMLSIAGVGQYELHLNGRTVSPPGLHQAWTDYRKTITYDTYDVTRQLRSGNNTVGVLLGNGMYNVQRSGTGDSMRYTKFVGTFGVPMMSAALRLRYANGSREVINSDASWIVHRGPVVFSSTYGGEDYDARLEVRRWDTSGRHVVDWIPAQIKAGPGGSLRAAIAPDVLEVKEYLPVHGPAAVGRRVVYDLGQNFAGWPRIRVRGSAGLTLRLTPGELLNADGSVSQESSGGPEWWSYTLSGKGEESWAPRFSYYGFRYLQAEWVRLPPPGGPSKATEPARGRAGTLLDVRGEELSSNSFNVGSFLSSDESLNAIHRMIAIAMRNNEVSLFTDCPHREKLGWLEETHLVAPGLLFNNDVQGLMRATETNIADAQTVNGMVPTIAPQYTKFGPAYAVFDDSPEWGSASVLAPWAAYRWYGDTEDLERAYPTMQAYVRYLESRANDGIVAYGLGDWYDIGPGNPGLSKQTTAGVTGTLMLLEDAMVLQKVAALLGHQDDLRAYAALVDRERVAFHRRFWNQKADFYDQGSQTANAMPLALGIVPEERRATVLQHVIDDIHAHKDHVTTGEIGYPYLVRALMEAGRGDVLLALMLQRDPPSYRSQLAAGATSLTEAWDANPANSQDHFMLGEAEEWFYRGLGGIDFDRSRPDSLVIRPEIVDGIAWVRTSYDSQLGKIEASWRRVGKATAIDVVVPAGLTAVVHVPVASESSLVLESGSPADKALGVQQLSGTPGEAIYRIGSGSYHFQSLSAE